ncbi:Dynein light chain 1, axonemal [Chamberlinius hualienensis]
MSKGSTIKEAIIKWEQRNGRKVIEVKELKLGGVSPPIEKFDPALNALSHLEKLSLTTNCIEKISYFNSFKNLKVLSLARNNIKSFAGLEALGEILEELWISYNQIERLTGIGVLKKLKVLYMSNNYVKEWSEFHKLVALFFIYVLLDCLWLDLKMI